MLPLERRLHLMCLGECLLRARNGHSIAEHNANIGSRLADIELRVEPRRPMGQEAASHLKRRQWRQWLRPNPNLSSADCLSGVGGNVNRFDTDR